MLRVPATLLKPEIFRGNLPVILLPSNRLKPVGSTAADTRHPRRLYPCADGTSVTFALFSRKVNTFSWVI
jgi:hypothetical protein